MAGESLREGRLTGMGLAGDRVVQVYDRRGRIATARTYPRLLQLRATLGADGEPLVDGWPWHSREVGRRVEAAVEPGAVLRLPGAEVGLVDLRGRCVMTTYDPDTVQQDPDVLRDIVRRFGGKLCLNATVMRPGRVEVGDRTDLVARRADDREG